ncbi:MAG: hypothetical protein ACTSPU_15955 [Promethearchaeota archaeon]
MYIICALPSFLPPVCTNPNTAFGSVFERAGHWSIVGNVIILKKQYLSQ